MRIPGERSGAKSWRNMETGGTAIRGKLKEAKGMGQNGERVKREWEPRIRTDRVFARSVFYTEREENENTYRAVS